MTCNVYKSESAKVIENIGCLRFVENKMKSKTCKLYFGTRKQLFLKELFCEYYLVGVCYLESNVFSTSQYCSICSSSKFREQGKHIPLEEIS